MLGTEDVCRPRTPLFTAGVLLTGLHALFGWLAGATLTCIALGTFPAAQAWIEAWELRLLDQALALAGLVGAYYLGLSSLQLLACFGAWFGARGWTWTLALLALFGLPSSGPISCFIAAVTVLGAMQVLDQSRAFPPPGGEGEA